MAELAKVGTFCPNPGCPDYEQIQEGGHSIIKFGHTRSGRRRYKCRRRGKAFTETRGAIFCRRRTDDEEIPECPAMIAEGSRISGVGRVKGLKEDTISAWIRDTAEDAESVGDILLSEFRISRGRIDGPQSYAGDR